MTKRRRQIPWIYISVDFDEEKKVFLSTPSGVLVGLLAVLRDTDGRRCCYEAESVKDSSPSPAAAGSSTTGRLYTSVILRQLEKEYVYLLYSVFSVQLCFKLMLHVLY